MRLYAETSAVVGWLLDEDSSPEVATALTAAEIVVTSELTLVEAERVFVRAASLGQLGHAEAAEARESLLRVWDYWTVIRLVPRVLIRASRAFPAEPVRTLDALHLASALEARDAVPGLIVLSLDDRIRSNARELGMEVAPQ